MKHTIIPAPSRILFDRLYIDSDIEWGFDKEQSFSFDLEGDTVLQAHHPSFRRFEGKPYQDLIDYVRSREKEVTDARRRIRLNFPKHVEKIKKRLAYERQRGLGRFR